MKFRTIVQQSGKTATGIQVPAEVVAQLGSSKRPPALTFRSSSRQPLLYRFAFTIPLKTWQQAKTWLKARTPLLQGEGEDEFESERVRTRSSYFPDPAGNILEFIARQDLPGKAGEDFGPEDILHISEIGLVVDDVPAVVNRLNTSLGVEVFREGREGRHRILSFTGCASCRTG